MEYTTLPFGTASPAPLHHEHHENQTSTPPRFPSEHTISFFEDNLPADIEVEMTQLYANYFSSPAKLRAYGQLNKASTYVAHAGGRATAIFLIRIEGKKIHVLNEQIHIPGIEISRFARYIFKRYKSATVICFKTVDTHLSHFSFPYQRTYFTNDVVLTLPQSVADYQASLGKATRENIKRYLKLLKRDFPDYRFEVTEKNEGGYERFRAIIDFNHARMSVKNKVSGINIAEAERLYELVGQCGMVCSVTINGRICAGTICYQVGDNYFMRVIAHDSAYNEYRTGLLCCYLTIAECILRGGKHYHFLWGREEYKYRLLGQHRDFDTLTIYRSYLRFFADLHSIVKVAVKAKLNKAKLWLLDPANKDKAVAFYAQRMIALSKKPRKVPRSA